MAKGNGDGLTKKSPKAPKRDRTFILERNKRRRMEKDARLKSEAADKWKDGDRTPRGAARAARRFGMSRKQHSSSRVPA